MSRSWRNGRAWTIGTLLSILPIALGCGESCGDIACMPAPTPLEVVVYDTVSIDTTMRRREGSDSIDVDTVLVRLRATPEAVVTLVTEQDNLLTTVDTLRRLDTIYSEANLARIPNGLFRIRAEVGDRDTVSTLRKIENVAGCCPYSIVGRFNITLPIR